MHIKSIELPKTGRTKHQIIKEMIDFLKNNKNVKISNFKKIGLSNKSSMDYIDLFNFFAEYFGVSQRIIVKKEYIDVLERKITTVKLKE